MSMARTIRKLIFIFLFFSLLVPFVCAEEASMFEFKLEPTLGLKAGKIGEYVWSQKNNENKRLSTLEWSLNPMWVASLGLELQLWRFDVSAYVTGGIPVYLGTMTDTDYVNLDDKITHFSSHNINLNHYLDVGGYLGMEFKPATHFFLTPYIGFSYQQTAMTGSDGYRQYSSESSGYTDWSADMEKIYMYGECIRYTQELLIPWIGLKATFLSYLFNKTPITIEATAQFSPYMWAYALDEHLLTGASYFDEMPGSWGTRLNAKSYFNITPKNALIFSLGGSIFPERIGNSYLYIDDFLYLQNGSGGTSFYSFDVSFGYRRLFF